VVTGSVAGGSVTVASGVELVDSADAAAVSSVSEMDAYAEQCTRVFEVRNLEQLAHCVETII
jgi:hypothetical protein